MGGADALALSGLIEVEGAVFGRLRGEGGAEYDSDGSFSEDADFARITWKGPGASPGAERLRDKISQASS